MSDYITVANLKLRINKTSDDDDAWLESIITAASRAIDNFCNRPDGFVADTVASARLYAGNGRAIMRIDECVEISLVAVKDSVTDDSYTSWAASGWIAFSGDPRDPDFNSLPYDHLMVDANGDEAVFTSGWISAYGTKDFYFRSPNIRYRYPYNPRNARGQPTVQVTAKWGYAATVPQPIAEACGMQAARWFKRYQSSMSDVLASGELGQLMYRQELDPDVKNLMVAGRYVRPAVGKR